LRLFAVLLALALPAAAAELKPWSGGPTPALELADLQGKKHSLADYRGKVVLVNFWATWCEPCREEMPSIERLRASLEGRPFAVLAVNLAEPESRIQKFLDTMPLRFPILLDRDTKTTRAWQAKVLPATYIVGADGAIRYRHVGELDWSKPEVREQIVALMK
jgi:cytochrome c biogenesis protein CcmG, thiol:disulfide interchange protein DsbE